MPRGIAKTWRQWHWRPPSCRARQALELALTDAPGVIHSANIVCQRQIRASRMPVIDAWLDQRPQ